MNEKHPSELAFKYLLHGDHHSGDGEAPSGLREDCNVDPSWYRPTEADLKALPDLTRVLLLPEGPLVFAEPTTAEHKVIAGQNAFGHLHPGAWLESCYHINTDTTYFQWRLPNLQFEENYEDYMSYQRHLYMLYHDEIRRRLVEFYGRPWFLAGPPS